MSNKVKTPWYRPILDFIDRRFNGSFSAFLITMFGVMSIFFAGLFIVGLLNSVNVEEKVESTTTYSETSTVVPVYTHAKEGSDDFNKVVADLEYYNTKPEKTELTRFSSYRVFGIGKEKGYERTYSLVDGKDAESLYYHTSGSSLNPVQDTFNYLLGMEDKDYGTLILYNRSTKTYETKLVKKMDFNRKYSKDSVKGHYEYKYGGYQGAPNLVYSYSPTVELIAYKDGSYKWNYKDNYKLDNEAELKAYISPSPRRGN